MIRNHPSLAAAHADQQLLEGSLLYREFQRERDEILRHKWFESEKAGHDIGFDKALLDWIVRHRTAWRACCGCRGPSACR
jgi:hypothetical protein